MNGQHGTLEIEKPQQGLVKASGTEMAVSHQSESLVSLLQRLATNPDFNPQSFEVLIAAAEREQLAARKSEFTQAMHVIQSKKLRVHKSKAAKNSKYAPLEEIDEKLQPHLTEHGLTVSYDCDPGISADGMMAMKLIVSHRNGYSETRNLPMPVDDIGTNREGKALRPKIQDHGSTVSYSRRQLLKMTFNIVETDEDDDGNRGESASYITQDQADTIVSKCEEYGFSAEDKARVIRFASALQGRNVKLAEIRRGDYGAVIGTIETMRSTMEAARR